MRGDELNMKHNLECPMAQAYSDQHHELRPSRSSHTKPSSSSSSSRAPLQWDEIGSQEGPETAHSQIYSYFLAFN